MRKVSNCLAGLLFSATLLSSQNTFAASDDYSQLFGCLQKVRKNILASDDYIFDSSPSQGTSAKGPSSSNSDAYVTRGLQFGRSGVWVFNSKGASFFTESSAFQKNLQSGAWIPPVYIKPDPDKPKQIMKIQLEPVRDPSIASGSNGQSRSDDAQETLPGGEYNCPSGDCGVPNQTGSHAPGAWFPLQERSHEMVSSVPTNGQSMVFSPLITERDDQSARTQLKNAIMYYLRQTNNSLRKKMVDAQKPIPQDQSTQSVQEKANRLAAADFAQQQMNNIGSGDSTDSQSCLKSLPQTSGNQLLRQSLLDTSQLARQYYKQIMVAPGGNAGQNKKSSLSTSGTMNTPP